MAFKLGETSKKRLIGVNPKLIRVIELALTITKIDFGIPLDGGVRTDERQNELFRLGASKLDGITNKSRHQFGDAFDVFAYVDGKANWDEGNLTHIATAILSAASQLGVPLVWGGHFGKDGWDKPHFEIKRGSK